MDSPNSLENRNNSGAKRVEKPTLKHPLRSKQRGRHPQLHRPQGYSFASPSKERANTATSPISRRRRGEIRREIDNRLPQFCCQSSENQFQRRCTAELRTSCHRPVFRRCAFRSSEGVVQLH